MSEIHDLHYCELCESFVANANGHDCNTSKITATDQMSMSSMKSQSEDNIIEVLIGLVQNKRALWDHRLPITQRGKNEKDKLWSEIWDEMGRIMPMESIQRKWKNLRDQFMKCKSQVESHVPSGSGSEIPGKKKIWKHYENMKFLQDTVQPKPTSSNLKSPLSLNISDESINNSDTLSPATSITKRKRKQENFEETLLKILDKPIPVPAPVPVPASAQISPSLELASELLQKLPKKVRMKAEREFINKLYDLVDEYEED